MKKTAGIFYFGCLFTVLSVLYFPAFSLPPRSDHWPALYFFHRIGSLLGDHKWQYILTYDPLIRVTFRPLSIMIPYAEKALFGPHLYLVQLTTFSLYCASIVLLYLLAAHLARNRVLIAMVLAVFAVLFSHFDLVCWSFQSHIIFSFCLFVAGFLLYIRHLNSGKRLPLLLSVASFLCGMLAYEVFVFWPFATLILGRIFRRTPKDNLLAQTARVVVPTYALYTLLFFLSRALRSDYGSPIALDTLMSFISFSRALFLVFFNTLYNNIMVNILPQVAFPLQTVDNNLNMGGFIASGFFDIDAMVFVGGGLTIAAAAALFWYVRRRGGEAALLRVLFPAVLAFLELFTLFYLKSLTNTSIYNLTQFRFQLIPNALLALLVIVCIDGLVRLTPRKTFLLAVVLSAVFLVNVYATGKGVRFVSAQLQPLERLLANIQTGFREGRITPEKRLYLDSEIAKTLPDLCWNAEMGKRCMRGTYQWVFSAEEIHLFAPPEAAGLVIDPKDLTVTDR